jgi:tetratricopeptide (TPR) repeat protein
VASRKKRKMRQELKQPDEFISSANKAWEWASNNIKRVVAAAVGFALVVGGVSAYRHFARKSAIEATMSFNKGLEIQGKTVIPGVKKLPTKKGELPNFGTHKEKLEAAEKAYSTTIKDHGGEIGRLATLLRAGVRYELGKHEGALKDYKKYLERKDGPEQLRVAAVEGLVFVHEAKKQWDDAIKALGELPPKKPATLYHRGRLLAAKGKKADAIKLLKDVAAKPGSYASLAKQQLATLQGN